MDDADGLGRDSLLMATGPSSSSSASSASTPARQHHRRKASGSGRMASSSTSASNVAQTTARQARQPRSTNTIVIHVNDDARKMSKDFLCDRDLLLK